MNSLVTDSFRDKVACGKLIKTDELYIHEHVDVLRFFLDFSQEIYEAHHLEYNSFTYKAGLLISENNCLLEIEKIIANDSNYFFVCAQYDFIQLNKFLNSIQIRKKQPAYYTVVQFSCLNNKNVYEKKVLEEEYYIILDTLELEKFCSSIIT